MTEANYISSTSGVGKPYDLVAPAAATSTDTYTAIASGNCTALPWSTISMTLTCATQSIKWTVYGANDSSYTGEVAVQAEATITAGNSGYFAAVAYYGYYRVKIVDAVGGTHGTGTLRALMK